MYDSITSFTETAEKINQDCLFNVNEFEIINTKERILKAELSNLKVTQNFSGISIKGSLPKYYLGNNLMSLTRQSTERAIEKIQDELCIKLIDSKVYRIDIAGNLIMNQSYENYLPLLIDCPYLKKSNFNDSIYFSNNKKQLVFYHKPREMYAKKLQFPEDLKPFEKNFLRYELRFVSRIKDQFNKVVRLSDLYNEDFYINILNKWKDHYFLITKLQNLKTNSMIYTTAKGFKDNLILNIIYEKGLDQILNDIDTNRDKFKSTVEASRCKAEIKRLAKNKDYSEPNNLILELDEKVKQAVKYYR